MITESQSLSPFFGDPGLHIIFCPCEPSRISCRSWAGFPFVSRLAVLVHSPCVEVSAVESGIVTVVASDARPQNTGLIFSGNVAASLLCMCPGHFFGTDLRTRLGSYVIAAVDVCVRCFPDGDCSVWLCMLRRSKDSRNDTPLRLCLVVVSSRPGAM